MQRASQSSFGTLVLPIYSHTLVVLPSVVFPKLEQWKSATRGSSRREISTINKVKVDTEYHYYSSYLIPLSEYPTRMQRRPH
ncbi:hypothetical protein LZ30DRAFT_715573 [Colletotrichum cereale]|nr:hypothetical protein LZ30DRAFT_715573 [Colletotrichum cereale]